MNTKFILNALLKKSLIQSKNIFESYPLVYLESEVSINKTIYEHIFRMLQTLVDWLCKAFKECTDIMP